MTPRFPQYPIDEVAPDVAEVYRALMEREGGVHPALKMVGHHPEYVRFAIQALDCLALPGRAITRTEQILVRARIASLAHSPYSVQAVWEQVELEGLMPRATFDAALMPSHAHHVFSEREQLVLTLAERVQTGIVDATLWTALQKHFADVDLLDLLVVACIEAMFASFTRSVGLTSADMPNLANFDRASAPHSPGAA